MGSSSPSESPFILLVDRATRSIASYVAGCFAAALTLGLIIAIKGVLQQGSGGISITQGFSVLFMISLTATVPILLLAWPAWLLVIAIQLLRGHVGMTQRAMVWAIVAVVVMLVLEGMGGHLVGPNSRQPSVHLFAIAVAGAMAGIVSDYVDRNARRNHETGTGDGRAQP